MKRFTLLKLGLKYFVIEKIFMYNISSILASQGF